MRIINQPIPGITKAYRQHNQENGVNSAGGSPRADEITISHEARFLHVAKNALRQLPNANEKKIPELRQAVRTGTYEVQNEAVAEKIWWESFGNERI